MSTTGHSTNFVMMMDLPSKEEEDVWVRAGVAAFLALRYWGQLFIQIKYWSHQPGSIFIYMYYLIYVEKMYT